MTPTLQLRVNSVVPVKRVEAERSVPTAAQLVLAESMKLAHRHRAAIVLRGHFLLHRQRVARIVRLGARTLTDFHPRSVPNAGSGHGRRQVQQCASTALLARAMWIKLT